MKTFRTLFTEMPYAAVLKKEKLLSRCSACFANATSTSCKGGCPVVYCSDQCRQIDWPSHQFECVVFRQQGSTDIDNFVRLLGRILTRRMVDGGIAHLSTGFPDYIPDRRLDELMSHQSEIEACKDRSESMDDALNDFANVFKDTPLVNDWEMIRRIYCVMWINCFSVSGRYHSVNGHEPSPGIGFYLNTSRFNHACKPDLSVDFDGSSIIIEYPSNVADDDKVAITEERLKLTQSAETFNRLTISYGFSAGSYFPLRHQRRASLDFAYYFECQCVLCHDEKEAILEEHAAVIECRTCGEPYIWKKVLRSSSVKFWQSDRPKIKCRKSCMCPSAKSEKEAIRRLKTAVGGHEMVALETEWTKALSGRMRDYFADQIVQKCKPVVEKAIQAWHPSRNLRLCQLCERTFISCYVLIFSARRRKEPIDGDLFKLAFQTGEMTIGWSQAHSNNTYLAVIAVYAHDLARVYEVAASSTESSQESVSYWNRSSHWFSFAASIWQTFGEKTANFVTTLSKRAQKNKKIAERVESAGRKEMIV